VTTSESSGADRWPQLMLLRVKSETSPEFAPGEEDLNIGSPIKRRKDEKPLSSVGVHHNILSLQGAAVMELNVALR
jgi:hypothetical protein